MRVLPPELGAPAMDPQKSNGIKSLYWLIGVILVIGAASALKQCVMG